MPAPVTPRTEAGGTTTDTGTRHDPPAPVGDLVRPPSVAGRARHSPHDASRHPRPEPRGRRPLSRPRSPPAPPPPSRGPPSARLRRQRRTDTLLRRRVSGHPTSSHPRPPTPTPPSVRRVPVLCRVGVPWTLGSLVEQVGGVDRYPGVQWDASGTEDEDTGDLVGGGV